MYPNSLKSSDSFAINTQLHQLERILSTITDGIVAIDKQGLYSYANEAAERILGVSKEEILHRTFYLGTWKLTTLDGNYLPVEETPFEKVLQTQKGVYGMKLVVERGDGEKIIMLTNVAPLYDAAGNFDGIVGVLTDITEQHETQERINAVQNTVAHDLRGPLTAIMGYADMLKQEFSTGMVDDPSLQHVEEILNGAEKINKMIEELVDTARIERGSIVLEKQPIHLAPYLRTLLQRSQKFIGTNQLTIQIPDDLPPVVADPDRLERIFQNLLSNALKFSPPDSEVIIQARRVGNEIIVSVKDKGKGISPPNCSRLFSRYYQVKGSQSSKGVGLGLYISRLLVEAHGGHIWALSKVGEGSTFEFTLPLPKESY